MYYLLGPVACFALITSVLWAPSGRCRCRPWEPCWPSAADWHALNDSLQGSLVRIRPVASVCHGSEYDVAACANLSSLVVDSGWRASNPNTLQDWVWEIGNGVEEFCPYTISPMERRQSICPQGRLPFYSAVVRSTSDIQASVRFASRHNLRLVIKNTGHDSAGRSSAPHSFQIHTSLLQNISLHKNFIARGSTTGRGPAVTLGAGVMQWQAYVHGATNGYTILGGECPTVGAIGGFLQGGGVSSIHSFTRGLAVDQVLEYQVVSANGDLITANEDNNQDLFWALKGGGGGTFGVVTEATVRVFPDDPVTVTSTKIEAAATNVLFWKEGVHELFRLLQRFNNLHVAGQLVISAPTKDSLQAGLELHFANLTDETQAIQLLRSEARALETYGISASTSVRVQRKASSELRMKPDVYPAHYGILEASVLISAATFHATDGPALIASKLSELTLKPNDILFTSNLGGRVAENTAIEIALHPAWREAAQLVTLVRVVEPSIEGKLSALNNLTARDVPILYSIDPAAKISYRNLGDPQEKEFQARYWGADNYARLAATKAAWDPSHLFMTSLGVGSEVWDAEGICRKRRGFRAKASSLIGM